jgi:glycosyltransferase involved in cell wall biosynthesis
MQLDAITPVILTFNEGPNIGRTLERLVWARRVVIVDSFSDDDTLEQAARFSNVTVYRRAFDSHAQQWNFAINETGIDSQWILALDADYQVTPELLEEIRALPTQPSHAGYSTRFTYCVFGRPLRGSAYPPVTTLYRRDGARYVQDGHTQRVVLEGTVGVLDAPMLHDDRKPLGAWLKAQDRYMVLEAAKVRGTPGSAPPRNLASRIRRTIVLGPFVVFLYCLFVKGALLDGRAGLYYALQRMLAECLLSLRLLEARFADAPERDRH